MRQRLVISLCPLFAPQQTALRLYLEPALNAACDVNALVGAPPVPAQTFAMPRFGQGQSPGEGKTPLSVLIPTARDRQNPSSIQPAHEAAASTPQTWLKSTTEPDHPFHF